MKTRLLGVSEWVGVNRAREMGGRGVSGWGGRREIKRGGGRGGGGGGRGRGRGGEKTKRQREGDYAVDRSHAL